MRIDFSYRSVPVSVAGQGIRFVRETTVKIITDEEQVGARATVRCHVNDKDNKFQARKAALKAAIEQADRDIRTDVWKTWHKQEGRNW